MRASRAACQRRLLGDLPFPPVCILLDRTAAKPCGVKSSAESTVAAGRGSYFPTLLMWYIFPTNLGHGRYFYRFQDVYMMRRISSLWRKARLQFGVLIYYSTCTFSKRLGKTLSFFVGETSAGPRCGDSRCVTHKG